MFLYSPKVFANESFYFSATKTRETNKRGPQKYGNSRENNEHKRFGGRGKGKKFYQNSVRNK